MILTLLASTLYWFSAFFRYLPATQILIYRLHRTLLFSGGMYLISGLILTVCFWSDAISFIGSILALMTSAYVIWPRTGKRFQMPVETTV